MATSARGTRNSDVGARVDSDTVILDYMSVLKTNAIRDRAD
jgi:hypothetical protein